MLDTLALVTYLMGNEPQYSHSLQLRAQFFNQTKITCVKQSESPQLRWKNVPPKADSLAVIIKDKQHYYWVVYNLPTDIHHLSLDANAAMLAQDQGKNSWGEDAYHTRCWNNVLHPATVELFALDKRFSTSKNMTGPQLEKKMQGHVMAEAIKTTA